MIVGKKVYLGPVEHECLEQLRQWRNRSELRRYFREFREISETMQEKWYTERVLGECNQVDFQIHDKETSKLIGHCGLYYIDWRNRKAEFTIYVGDDSYRGQGYGSDALRTLIEYGFNELNLNKIWCEVFSNNDALGLYKRIGFVQEGVLRQHQWCEGKWLDSTVLSLLQEEWQQHTASVDPDFVIKPSYTVTADIEKQQEFDLVPTVVKQQPASPFEKCVSYKITHKANIDPSFGKQLSLPFPEKEPIHYYDLFELPRND